MRIVFFGTPDYVIPVVEKLLKHFRSSSNVHPISAVITQEPKPSGRDKRLTYSPVDEWAYDRKIPKFFSPQDVIKENIEADIGVLASYGQIIHEEVLKYFKYGILNIHPSLLPLWRGASPVQASIVSGEKLTGVSIIKLDDKLDHGSIVSQFKDEVQDTDTTETLRKRLFERSAEVMPNLIEAYVSGKTNLKKQDEEKVTFCRQIKKEDGFIPPEYLSKVINGKTSTDEWEIPWIYKIAKSKKQKAESSDLKTALSIKPSAISLFNFIRAMDPWPGAWTFVQLSSKLKAESKKRLKILKAHIEESQSTANRPPSTSLVPNLVQLEGKSPVPWKQFQEGYPEAKFE